MPQAVAQVLVALAGTTLPILLRLAIDKIEPGAGPFALIYPAVMGATLFGRWQAGLLTLIASLVYTWFAAIIPYYDLTSDSHVPDTGPVRIVVNLVALLAVLAMSEAFRSAARHAIRDNNAQIEMRDLLLAEFDHRIRNNFASVTSLLQYLARRAQEPAARDAMNAAIARVEGIARAHHYLYRDSGHVDRVDMQKYMGELCRALAESLFTESRVQLTWYSTPATLDRERAVSIGLLVNELVTNAAKHAFPDNRPGTVHVKFLADPNGIRLCVEDDGCGFRGEARKGSLGRRLMDALVRRAGGLLQTETGPAGTRITLSITSGG